jgi:hypothetical protein
LSLLADLTLAGLIVNIAVIFGALAAQARAVSPRR